VVGEPDAPGVPLLADRPLVDGRAAAYVCRGFVCDRPTVSPADLERQLRGKAAGGGLLDARGDEVDKATPDFSTPGP
jgi:hypothetical protein